MLTLQGIKKHYYIAGKKNLILDGIDLEVKRSEIIAITGKSGCGKSTLLNIISGLVSPNKGSITLDNKKLGYLFDTTASLTRNRKIGFIFQTFRLLPDETVMSNVLMPAMIKGIINKKTKDYVNKILKNLEIYDLRNMKASLLSGGQKQRTAIARALINNPDIILADEPTANLDKETAKEIADILERLANENKIIISVSHQKMIFKMAKRIYTLANGKLERTRE